MRLWKSEVWPWNWRKVGKAQSSLPDENSFQPPDEELQKRAELLAGRATQLLAEITPESAGVSAGVTYKAIASTQDFMQSQSCYAELARRQDIRRADRDRKHNEKIEKRDFWMEVGVMVLIGLEIALSIYYGQRGLREGKEQGAILEQMNKNTKDTAAQIQKAADAVTASLEILRQDRAERGKKPKLALYVRNIPIDQAKVRLESSTAQDTAHFDLFVKNEGDAPSAAPRLHALTPEGAGLTVNGFLIQPEFGPPLPRNAERWTVQLPQLPVGETTTLQIQFYAQKRHAPFKVTFTLDAPELQTVVPLGSLAVLPPKQ